MKDPEAPVISLFEEKHYAVIDVYKWSFHISHLPTHDNWLFTTTFNSLQTSVGVFAFFSLCTIGLLQLADYSQWLQTEAPRSHTRTAE